MPEQGRTVCRRDDVAGQRLQKLLVSTAGIAGIATVPAAESIMHTPLQ
jgi:hypothetical protein